MLFSGGCNCCKCTEQNDIFGNLSRWDIVSGSWTAGVNQMLATGAGEAVFDYTPHGTNPVRARVNLVSGGANFRINLGRQDADNLVFAEVKPETSSGAKDGYFAIGSRVAGVETIEKWKFQEADLTNQTLTVCYRDDLTPPRLVAYFGVDGSLPSTVRNFMREVPATGARKASISILSGSATFENWYLDCVTINPLDCGEQANNGSAYPGAILSSSDDIDPAVIGDLRICAPIHNRGASYYCGFGSFGFAVFVPSFAWKSGRRAYVCFRLLDEENYCFVRFIFTQSSANGFLSVDIGHVEAGAETILASNSGPSIALDDFTSTGANYSISVQGDDIEVQCGGYAIGGDFTTTTTLPTIDGDSWHFARGVGALLDSPGELTVEYSVHGLDESTPWDNSCIGCGI